MKARRKSDGKIIEVEEAVYNMKTEEPCHKCLSDGHHYPASELDFNLDADTVIKGWVFVDETTFDRILCVRKVTQGEYEAVWDSGHPEFCLGDELFPDMVPNTLPEPVEIIIKRKKK